MHLGNCVGGGGHSVGPDIQEFLVELAEELGYKKDKNVFTSENGKFRKL